MKTPYTVTLNVVKNYSIYTYDIYADGVEEAKELAIINLNKECDDWEYIYDIEIE